MRRTAVLVVAVSLALSACAKASPPAHSAPLPSPSGDLLLVGDGTEIQAVNADTGAVEFGLDGAVLSPDRSLLFDAKVAGGQTTIRAFDAATGRETDGPTVDGELAIVAVSGDGTRIALTAPYGDMGFGAVPPGREATSVTVVDRAAGTSRTYDLDGNYVPEAFSASGCCILQGGSQLLFMLQFNPPTAPTSYRVTSMDLDKGRISDVLGPAKEPVENMTATRLQQVASPDGSTLYTLYSNQPPAYLAGNGATAPTKGEQAFVHTLQLDGGLAICVRLPASFGTVPASASAIAVSPDGSTIYAVDALHGRVASMGAENLEVTSAPVSLRATGAAPIAAAVSEDGSKLFVSTGGASIIVVDTGTLSVGSTWTAPATVTDLRLSASGSRLYLAAADGVDVLDPATGAMLGTIPVPAQSIDFAGSLEE
jgi:DNA-binding beta-propeller fold protein YncE